MSEDMINIKIKLTNACIYDVSVPKSAKVKELKEVCSKHENILVAADEQHLLSKGRILDDEEFLSGYDITNDHTMILVKKSYQAKSNKNAIEEEEEETTSNKGTHPQANFGGLSGMGGINQGDWGNYSGLSNVGGFGSYGRMIGHGGFESYGGIGGHGSFGSYGGMGGHGSFGGPGTSALSGVSSQGPSSSLSSLGASSNHSGLGASSSLSGLGANQPSGTDAMNMNTLITMLSDPSTREILLNNPQIKPLLDANPQMRVMMSNPQRLQMMLNSSAASDGTGTFENIGNPKELYKDENKQLKDMGFTDEELNYNILAQTFGNVDGAVEKLLNMMN